MIDTTLIIIITKIALLYNEQPTSTVLFIKQKKKETFPDFSQFDRRWL